MVQCLVQMETPHVLMDQLVVRFPLGMNAILFLMLFAVQTGSTAVLMDLAAMLTNVLLSQFTCYLT